MGTDTVGVAISMFDERISVERTTEAIRQWSGHSKVALAITQSDDGQVAMFGARVLPNLADTVPRVEVPSRALSRNIAASLRWIADHDVSFVVALTGDTLVTDATNFDRRYAEMREQGKVAAVAQAIGQDFHAAAGPHGGRPQIEGVTTDIMPQLFILDGAFFRETRALCEIPVTNPFTSEQCLGDALVQALGPRKFHESVLMLNAADRSNAYSYSDGVRYHARYK